MKPQSFEEEANTVTASMQQVVLWTVGRALFWDLRWMGTEAGRAAPTPYKDLLAKRASPKRYFAHIR